MATQLPFKASVDPVIKFRLYRFSVWCGLIVLVAFTVSSFIVGNLFPPISPSAGPAEVKEFLVDNRTNILVATVILGIFAPLFYPFAIITSLQIRRIEGGWGLLSMLQLATAIVAPTGWVYPMAVLATAAYRPERDADLMMLLSDQYWLTYIGVAVIFVVNVASIGLAILLDRRAEPIFPRWLGWMNLVLSIAFFPGVFVYLVTDGPLAWDGIFALGIPSTAFFIWKICMIWALRRAVNSQEKEEQEAAAAGSPVAV
ncbi:MAG: hypothetical protein ACJ72O_01665 [Marmoricola sp.]